MVFEHLVLIFKYKVKIIKNMKKTQKAKMVIVPMAHPKFGIVYQLNEGNSVYGQYTSQAAAEVVKLKVLRLREEIKIIEATQNTQLEVEL